MPTNQSKIMQAFSGQARMLATPVVYVDFMGGSHAGALFLSQLIFWSDKGGKKDGWFYKSYKEWDEEVRLSRHHVNKFSQALVEAGVLETQVRKANGFPTLHYKLDMDKLTIAFCEFLQKGNDDDSDMRKVANPFVNFRKTITEDYIQNTEAENTNYVSIASDEKPSPDTPPESDLPVIVSEFEMPLVNLAGTLHNVVPVTAQVFAELLPAEPTPVKAKLKKAAAPKLSKPPKEPREMNERDLTFLAKITQLNPLIAPDVEKRLGEYRRSNPWSVTQIFLLTGIWPNKNNWNSITSLNGVEFDTEKLVLCFNAWTAKGWSPKNLAWLLEWYKAGGPPQYGKYGQQQPAPAPVVVKSDAELEAENDKHNAEVLAFHEWLVDTGRDTRTGYNAITRAGAAVSNVDLPYYDQEKLWYAEYQAEQ